MLGTADLLQAFEADANDLSVYPPPTPEHPIAGHPEWVVLFTAADFLGLVEYNASIVAKSAASTVRAGEADATAGESAATSTRKIPKPRPPTWFD